MDQDDIEEERLVRIEQMLASLKKQTDELTHLTEQAKARTEAVQENNRSVRRKVAKRRNRSDNKP